MDNFLLIIIIFLVACICLECFLRISGIGIRWDIDLYGNRRSLRNRQISETVKRVVCIGDSLTFGMHLAEQNSYPSQLYDKLQNRPGNSIDVRNAGISGHTSIQVLERLDRDVIAFCPDIVVVWIGTNDGMLRKYADSRSDRPFDKPPVLYRSVLLTTIYAWEWLMPIVNLIRNSFGNVNGYTARVNPDEFKMALSSIFRKLKQAGITKIIAVNIPRIPDHFMNYPINLVKRQREIHSTYNEVIAVVAKSYDISVLDATCMLSNRREKIFMRDGLHFTSSGYKMVAEVVFQEVITILHNT